MMDLVYCADGNRRFAEIAVAAGYQYGAQPTKTVYLPLWFADQDWKRPNREKYMTALSKHKPHMATVLDLERPEQLPEVLSWAEDAAQYVDVVQIIPKYSGAIAELPQLINGKKVRLGYSVPTSYGGSDVPLWEYYGWPVHLLGGNPKKQMEVAHYLDVRSADGNSIMKAAMYGEVWKNGKWIDGPKMGRDFIYHCFSESCRNVMDAWHR